MATLYKKYESPLSYYLAHPELHGLGRTELGQIDSGLLRALYRSGEINIIQKKVHGEGGGRPQLNEEKIMNIISAYYVCDGHLTRAAELVHHDQVSVRRYWRMFGLKASGKRISQLPLREIDRIIRYRDRYRTIRTTAIKSGHSPTTIVKYVKIRGGEVIRGRPAI